MTRFIDPLMGPLVRSPALSMTRSVLPSLSSTGFGPSSLFTSGAQGAWYDPSDFSTLFQNAAGTTPVTAVEQPVRLMLDRSKGLVLGPELVISPYSGSASGTWAVGATSVTRNSSSAGQVSVNLSTAISTSKWYQVQFTVSNLSGDTFFYRVGASGTPNQVTANGAYIARVPGGGTGSNITFAPWAGTAGEVTISNISVRELPGAHATAPNDASRPVLRARYNLLERTEEFDNGYWTKTNGTVTANAGVAPDGTTTADKLIVNNAVNSGRVQRVTTLSAATAYRVSMYAKAAEWGWLAFRVAEDSAHAIWFDISTGVVGANEGTWTDATITALANGWYRCQATYTTVGTSYTFRFLPTNVNAAYSTGNGTSGILIWGAQLLTAADQAATGGAYQRVAAATDYDTSNPVWRPYLAFDGSDDSFSTSSIDFSATDEMTVFAGVTFLTSVANQILYNTGSDPISTAGTFALRLNLADKVQSLLHGSSLSNFEPTIPTVPSTNVFTQLMDIGAAITFENCLRINGASSACAINNAGTGNFSASAPLHIGRLGGASNPLNGRLYSLAVLGRTATAAEISAMEAWVAGKTGVTLP